MNMRGSVLVRATAVSYADLFVDFFLDTESGDTPLFLPADQLYQIS